MKVPDNMNANQKAIFDKFQDVLRGVAGEKSEPLSSALPAVKSCATRRELGDWFAQFGRACRAAIPPGAST